MWLPLKPHDFDEEDEDVVMESVSTSIPLSKFMIFDGEDRVYKELGEILYDNDFEVIST